jgi:hypothetical protein
MNVTHLSDRLFAGLTAVHPYPRGVVPVPSMIPRGTAFFPGGRGVWYANVQEPIPAATIGRGLVLGNNYGTVARHARLLRAGVQYPTNNTWAPLLRTFCAAGVNPADFFYTNALMGLIDGGSMIQRFPGLADQSFVDRCVAFLHEQLSSIQPRFIVVLGVVPGQILVKLIPDLHAWDGSRRFKHLDAAGLSVVGEVRIPGLQTQPCCALLTHPCYPANAGIRRFNGEQGARAESLMVRMAAQAMGIPVSDR